MDRRDFEILLALTRRPFASNEALGRGMGITGNAFRTRLERMEHRGLLKGYYVLPAASTFRRSWQVVPFEHVDPEPDLDRVLEVDDVVNVWRGRPRTLMVNVYARFPEDPPPARLQKVVRRPPMATVLPEPPNPPGWTEAILSPLEWRVMDALLDAPRASLAQLAERTGLSPRTVRSRRDWLFDRGLLRVLPNFDTTGEPGLLIYSGFVVAANPSALDQLTLPGVVVLHRLHRPAAAWIFGHATSYAELQEVEGRLRDLPKVVSVDLVPSRGGALAAARLHRWIREQLRVWKGRPAAGSNA